jgi:hypothetical protein
LSSIDDDGELLVSSCSGRFSKKQLPSSNCRSESYDPVLLIFYVGLGEIAKVNFK